MSLSNAPPTLNQLGNCWRGLFEPLDRAILDLGAYEYERSKDESQCLDEIDDIAESAQDREE